MHSKNTLPWLLDRLKLVCEGVERPVDEADDLEHSKAAFFIVLTTDKELPSLASALHIPTHGTNKSPHLGKTSPHIHLYIELS